MRHTPPRRASEGVHGNPTRKRESARQATGATCGLKGRPNKAQGQRRSRAALGHGFPKRPRALKGRHIMDAIEYDDSDWTPEEMIALAQLAFDDADNAGPIEEPAA